MKWHTELLLLLLLTGCQDMYEQPKRDPLMPSAFFDDGQSARLPVPGTVARGQLRTNEAFFTGRVGTNFVTTLPIQLSQSVLERGRERFDIHCATCHGRLGDGVSIVVQRGLQQPPSLHILRLRDQPVGYFYDVITRGFGRMPDYAASIEPADRWAIAAYVRVLQYSQHAPLTDVPAAERTRLEVLP